MGHSQKFMGRSQYGIRTGGSVGYVIGREGGPSFGGWSGCSLGACGGDDSFGQNFGGVGAGPYGEVGRTLGGVGAGPKGKSHEEDDDPGVKG